MGRRRRRAFSGRLCREPVLILQKRIQVVAKTGDIYEDYNNIQWRRANSKSARRRRHSDAPSVSADRYFVARIGRRKTIDARLISRRNTLTSSLRIIRAWWLVSLFKFRSSTIEEGVVLRPCRLKLEGPDRFQYPTTGQLRNYSPQRLYGRLLPDRTV